MTLRQLISFLSVSLLSLTSVGAQTQKSALQAESAILLREDGTPRCRIGANPSEYLTAEKLDGFYQQAPGIDFAGHDTLRECDKGDELYAISILRSEDVHMAGIPSLVKWAMTALTGFLAFSIYKNYLPSEILVNLSEEKSVGDHTTGERYKVPTWQWVAPIKLVMNSYSNGRSETNHCGITMGGEIEVLHFTKDETQALVRYTFSGDTRGTSCRSGARFFLNVSQLNTMNMEYENKITAIEAIKKSAELITSGESLQSAGGLSTGDTFQVLEWQWVTDLRNLITNQHRSIVSLDGREVPSEDVLIYGSCGIKMGGEIRILGFTENESQALVRYTFSGNTSGTPCSNGAIFFLNVSQLDAME